MQAKVVTAIQGNALVFEQVFQIFGGDTFPFPFVFDFFWHCHLSFLSIVRVFGWSNGELKERWAP
jgi:hypothetical protein